jgi:hypothetical protein
MTETLRDFNETIPVGADITIGTVALVGDVIKVEASPYQSLTPEQWDEHAKLSHIYGTQGHRMDSDEYAQLVELERIANDPAIVLAE